MTSPTQPSPPLPETSELRGSAATAATERRHVSRHRGACPPASRGLRPRARAVLALRAACVLPAPSFPNPTALVLRGCPASRPAQALVSATVPPSLLACVASERPPAETLCAEYLFKRTKTKVCCARAHRNTTLHTVHTSHTPACNLWRATTRCHAGPRGPRPELKRPETPRPCV